jgi:DnaK suppressor protein
MADERTELIRKTLLTLREDLLADVRRKNAEAAELRDEGVPDVADLGLTDHLGEYLHLLGDSRREEVRRIDEALERLEKGMYGVCAECGEEIEAERLQLRPHTRYCVACKEALERLEERRSGVTKGTL